MQTTYQSSFTSRREPSRRVVAPLEVGRRYNDPALNYDDPAFPPPPFISRLQPVSFTSSMAPTQVAHCPVKMAYDPHEYQGSVRGMSTDRFSTTSLAAVQSAAAANEQRRLGMTGPESFQFALRADTGLFTSQPQKKRKPVVRVAENAPARTQPAGPRGPAHLRPSETAKLPLRAFHYHVNHSASLQRENARQARLMAHHPRTIVTSDVQPRAVTREQHLAEVYRPPNMPPAQLFPYSFEPGRLNSTARMHAFDQRTLARIEPIYDAFPLHPQQREFQPAPGAQKLMLDERTSTFRPSAQLAGYSSSLTRIGSHAMPVVVV